MAHAFGAWILAKAMLDTHAPLAAPAPIRATASALGFGDSDEEDEDNNVALQHEEDAVLIDTSFLTKRRLDKGAAIAADESLIRLLEAGPSSLDTVREAAGALKALVTGCSSWPSGTSLCTQSP